MRLAWRCVNVVALAACACVSPRSPGAPGSSGLYPAPAVERSWGSNGVETLHGYIDRSGRMVIPPSFDHASPFSDGYAVVSNDVWGLGFTTGPTTRPNQTLVDTSGTEVMSHASILGWSEGRAIIADWVDDHTVRVGWVDLVTKAESGLRFAHLGSFSEGLAAAVEDPAPDAKWGFIDRAGGFVIAPRFEVAGPFVGGHARVEDGGKQGLIDRQGNVVLPIRYGEVAHGKDAWVVVRDDSLAYRFVDVHGAAVSLAQAYGYAKPFEEGFAVATTTNADGTVDYGYIRRDGTWLVRVRSAGSYVASEEMGFHDGAAILPELVDGGWSYRYIGTGGRPLSTQRFAVAHAFRDGLALTRATQTSPYAYIDVAGKVVWRGAGR